MNTAPAIPSAPPAPLIVRRTHHPPCIATRRVCEAASLLGVPAPDLLRDPAPSPASFTLDLTPGALVLISGVSGSGKSTALRDIADAARTAGIRVVAPTTRDLPDRPVIDLLPEPVERAMRTLAGAGLGEAACLVRRPSQLSEGQRARLRLALAKRRALRAARAGQPVVLCCDEFASTLDRRHALSLATLIGRLRDEAAGAPLAIVLATPRDDLLDALAPDIHIRCLHAGRAIVEAPVPASADAGPELHIREGTALDYDRLAHLHYRAGPPATVARILVAECSRTGRAAGVLVTSMPTLNASWRRLAWPGRYSGGDRRADTARLNREVRCISRVIVDPAWRSLGVARMLVAAYLRRPETPCTEALAAMGRACPFFERAGMTPYPMPPTERDARLLDALGHAGVEPWRLALPDEALRRAVLRAGLGFIERETRLWARDSRASRRHARDDLPALFARACAAISARPVAYAHTAADH